MVVPKMATIMVIESPVSANFGSSVPDATASQSTCTANTTPT